MADDKKPKSESKQGPEASHEARKGFFASTKAWQKIALAVSVVLMVVGVASPMLLGDTRAPAMVADPHSPGATGFLPTDTPPTDEDGQPATVTDDEVWSPAIFRTGFGFFLAFAVGYAIRSLMKITLVAIGLFALALFGLDYAGIVEIRWAMMQSHSDEVGSWLGQQVSSFQAFVTGYLPATGASIAGLAAGLNRR